MHPIHATIPIHSSRLPCTPYLLLRSLEEGTEREREGGRDRERKKMIGEKARKGLEGKREMVHRSYQLNVLRRCLRLLLLLLLPAASCCFLLPLPATCMVGRYYGTPCLPMVPTYSGVPTYGVQVW